MVDWWSIPRPTRILSCIKALSVRALLQSDLLPHPASKVGATRRDAEKNVSWRAAGPPAVMQ